MTDFTARYKAPDWPVLRRRVFERDGWRCVTCGSSRDLRCHHLTYERFGKELLSDLTTQCKKCHAKGEYGWTKIQADKKALFWLRVGAMLTRWGWRPLKVLARVLWWLTLRALIIASALTAALLVVPLFVVAPPLANQLWPKILGRTAELLASG